MTFRFENAGDGYKISAFYVKKHLSTIDHISPPNVGPSQMNELEDTCSELGF